MATRRTTNSPAGNGFLTRTEALEVLAVKPATLYTYVSRGLIRRLATPGRKQSLYYREDVERVRARHDARAAEGVVAAAAVRYGEPIVPTSITEITAGGPRYRNRSAIELATSGVSFEATAELLWTGMLREDAAWHGDPPSAELAKAAQYLAARSRNRNLHDVFAMVTTLTGMSLGAPDERAAETAAQLLAARQLIFTLTGCFGVLAKSAAYRMPRRGESVAEAIARSVEVDPNRKIVAALNAALTLAADHELNPATFVARIAASSEGDLHSCVAAAISTNAGTRIARGCDRLDNLLRDPAQWQRLPQRLAQRGSAADIAAWGFSHPLYPAGDPRGACLLAIIDSANARHPKLSRLLRDIETVKRSYQLTPRFETSLVLLCIALRLPPGTAAGLYTLGRVAGWVAHIAEQRLAGFLIRPRAKFNA
jgi:citrate synthase